MKTCPACGYKEGVQYDYRKEMISLYKKRRETTQLLLKTAINRIVKSIPSERKHEKMFLFLKGIDMVDDNTVCWAVNRFLVNEYYNQQKGFSYLKAMIINAGENSDIKAEYEKKKIGTLPKERRLK